MKLKSQMFILSFTLGFLTILIFDILFYRSVKQTITQEVYHHLESVSALKVERLKRMIRNNFERLIFIKKESMLIETLHEYIQTGEKILFNQINKDLRETSDGLETINGIHFVNPAGRVIVSSDASFLGKDFSQNIGFMQSLNGRQTVDGVYLSLPSMVNIYLTSPIYYKGKLIAVLIVDSDGENFVNINKDYTGLGETGETTIARRMPNGQGVYLTPLRFDAHAALRRTILTDTNLASNMALSKKEGLFKDAMDYRGEEVFAVTKYIPETGWGIVTKIDKIEALAPIKRTRNMILVISLCIGVLIFLITWAFGNYLTKPLQALTEFSQRVKKGYYKERISDMPNNEIGILATSFNDLVQKLEKSNEEISKTLVQLKQSNESLSNFAYTITHDLKSPLSTIEGLIDIIKLDGIEFQDPKNAQILEMVNLKVKHMGEMISKVLEYAKAGNVAEMEKVSVKTGQVVRDVISSLKVPDNFEFVIDPDLPIVSYQEVLLYQVFQNIIGNSVKYMDKEFGRITIGYKETDRFWQLFVSDNGPGIEEKNFDKIFLMLRKVAKENIESTGIGLATVKKIVTDNGGDVWVKSKKGEGATFYFTIPKK